MQIQVQLHNLSRKQVLAIGQASGKWYVMKRIIIIRFSIRNHSCINLKTE